MADEYTYHEVAAIFPLMGEDRLQSLVKSIREKGQQCPILVTTDNQIVDGRHRYLACRMAGVEPKFEVTTETDSVALAELAWLWNEERRQLDKAQRDAAGVNMDEFIAKAKQEAKKKRASAGGKAKAAKTLGAAKVSRDTLAQKQDDTKRTTAKVASLVGSSHASISRAAVVKREAPDLFEKMQKGEIKTNSAYKQVKKRKQEAENKEAAEKARQAIEAEKTNGVFHGNSFELAGNIPNEACSLIFTDPPYDRNSLPMFKDLGCLASRILVDGGSLITYCGQYVLDDVISYVSEPESIRFFWITCCLHTGATAQMREYGIKVKWKPMLWFVKGNFRRDRETWVEDLVKSQQEKESHPWQQSVIEASYYIEKLTVKDELVVDPFCGGGTTAVAAKQLERQWWTADVDPRHVKTARERLQ